MKPLSAILPPEASVPASNGDSVITGLALDSRNVVEGGLFAAIAGNARDGHSYIADAVRRGAQVILYQHAETALPAEVTGIRVEDPARILALIAHNFYDRPSEELAVIGITGTNGKTSACSFLYQLFTQLGYRTGLIATTGIFIDQEEVQTNHTTPDAITLAQLLRRMADSKVTHVFMEVSSHALVQERVTGITFRGAAFTNITHEHLDYHGTFQAYIKAKQRLFRMLPSDAFALTNRDDRRGLVMTQDTRAHLRTYGLQGIADYQAQVGEHDMNGMALRLGSQTVYTTVIGTFNAYNLLLAYGIGRELGLSEPEALTGLSLIKPPKGRMQLLHGANDVTGIVDYAHSADALMQALQTIQAANKHAGQVLVVLGCGGDRDTAKRPEMLRTALSYAHQVIITADNPRSEDPAAIAKDMEAGASEEQLSRVLTILDREQAIKTATRLAGKGAIILVAGKGHECHQEIDGVSYPFSDQAVLAQSLNIERHQINPSA
jgi:UDP-N-acetylmuramoyl-L-alanyl-D-glutamate--2,6-diaminopimelate ligase